MSSSCDVSSGSVVAVLGCFYAVVVVVLCVAAWLLLAVFFFCVTRIVLNVVVSLCCCCCCCCCRCCCCWWCCCCGLDIVYSFKKKQFSQKKSFARVPCFILTKDTIHCMVVGGSPAYSYLPCSFVLFLPVDITYNTYIQTDPPTTTL